MIAVPMHYGTIVGSDKDAETFRDMVTVCTVNMYRKYIAKRIVTMSPCFQQKSYETASVDLVKRKRK
jgi:hypothetical protein